MVDNNTMTWLSFSITPVQRFIESARTVRDLKTGSEILCWLTDTAIRAAKARGGELLFPYIEEASFQTDKYVQHIPNQFIMLFDDEESAQSAGDSCREAVNTAWKTLSDQVKKLFDDAWGDNWNPENQWNRQSSSYWDMQISIIPPADDTLHQKLFGGTSETDFWRRQWKVAAAYLAMNKQIRHFPGNQGIGRAKCSMMGQFEQMGPGGTLHDQDKFWTQRKVNSFTRRGIRIGEKDRLCAISLIKRFASVAEKNLNVLNVSIPDTATLAMNAWLEEIKHDLPEQWTHWQNTINDYVTAMGEEADTPGRYLLADELHAPKEGEIPDNNEDQAKALFQKMKSARESLFKEIRNQKKKLAPRYFAILTLDGDNMGKWLSGDRTFIGETRLDEKYYQKMSGDLRDYGQTKVKNIVEEDYHGYLVYAGGDDVLAFLPIKEVLPCAIKLKKEYPSLNGKQKATASVGISICHYLHDLRSALRHARAALDEAKESGRDRIGWRLIKRSGGNLHGILETEMVSIVQDMVDLFSTGISDRWVYRLAQVTEDLHPNIEIEPANLLRKHALKRVDASSEEKEVLEKRTYALWEETVKNVEKCAQHWNEKTGDSSRYKWINYVPGYMTAFVDTLLLAIFINRGRD